MSQISLRSLAGVLSLLFFCAGCGQSDSGSRLTSVNYDQITNGMSKAQVEKVLGPPTKEETKQALLFVDGQTRWQPVVTCRYEDGEKFIEVTFKDDQVDKKDSNLGRAP